MVVVATEDPEVVRAVRRMIKLEGCISKAVTAKELRHRIHELQPHAILLDVRLGGNRYRALSVVPGLIRVRSMPAVLALLPFDSAEADHGARGYGCVNVLRLDDPFLPSHVSSALKLALSERRDGLRRVAARSTSVQVH